MATYFYQALGRAGAKTKGIIEGDSEKDVRQKLRVKGLTPLLVRMNTPKSVPRNSSFTKKIKTAELSLFTRQLFTLIDAGKPLAESLQAIKQQSPSKRIEVLSSELFSNVSEGLELSRALEICSFYIDGDVIAMVKAGEESGHLSEVLSQLSDSIEKKDQVSKKVKKAMAYPVIMLTISLLIVAGLLIYVVPQVVGVFDKLDQELPVLTQYVLSSSNFIRDNGVVFMLVVTALLFFARRAIKHQRFLQEWQKILLRLPLFRKMIITSAIAKWSRTTGMLLKSGVPVTSALKISIESTSFLPIRQAIEEVYNDVNTGSQMSAKMKNHQYFPPLLVNLVETGEGGGNVDDMLIKSAEHFEQEVENDSSMLVAIMEPLLIAFLGLFVVLIVLAIMMPIFQMNSMVGL